MMGYTIAKVFQRRVSMRMRVTHTRDVFLSVLSFAAAVFVSMAALAQEVTDEHRQAARAAMEATGASVRLDSILPQLASFQKAALIANRPDIESEISDTVDEVAISLASRRGDLEKEIVDVYTRKFTQAELESISSFFSSETGIKFLTNTPILFREIDEISAVWRQGINRDMTKEVTEKLKEKGL
jgi:hypothetical protein